MDKKILFITEGKGTGSGGAMRELKYVDARTDIAWRMALKARHNPIWFGANYIENLYDLIILIIPKKIELLDYGSGDLDRWENKYKFIRKSLNKNGKFAVMQEGPNWYFQDYSIKYQYKYLEVLNKADFLLCHNDADTYYYSGLTNKPTYVMQSLMIEDTIKDLENVERKNCVIGGNFVSWYSGIDSFIVAQELKESFDEDVYAPSMGRMQKEENIIGGLSHIQYKNWTEWIKELNKFKYAVHLMRTHAAGTFALNCSYLGLPCIGYYGLDTQRILHPSLTVEVGDLYNAKKLANQLKEDKSFYEYCSNETKTMYNMFYTEKVFLEQFEKILEKENV